jgi:hypothetical protein
MSFFSNIAGLHLLMLVMLAFATVAFTLMAMVTVSNAWRLRNPLISWRAGKFYGFPLFASIFLAFTLFTAAVLIESGGRTIVTMMVCYSWIGATWWLTSFQLSKRFITDYGVVKNVNDPSQTVSWNQIRDYIEHDVNHGKLFIFLYLIRDADSGVHKTHRLELFVPQPYVSSFSRLIEFKLRRRFMEQPVHLTGHEALK